MLGGKSTRQQQLITKAVLLESSFLAAQQPRSIMRLSDSPCCWLYSSQSTPSPQNWKVMMQKILLTKVFGISKIVRKGNPSSAAHGFKLKTNKQTKSTYKKKWHLNWCLSIFHYKNIRNPFFFFNYNEVWCLWKQVMPCLPFGLLWSTWWYNRLCKTRYKATIIRNQKKPTVILLKFTPATA